MKRMIVITSLLILITAAMTSCGCENSQEKANSQVTGGTEAVTVNSNENTETTATDYCRKRTEQPSVK